MLHCRRGTGVGGSRGARGVEDGLTPLQQPTAAKYLFPQLRLTCILSRL